MTAEGVVLNDTLTFASGDYPKRKDGGEVTVTVLTNVRSSSKSDDRVSDNEGDGCQIVRSPKIRGWE